MKVRVVNMKKTTTYKKTVQLVTWVERNIFRISVRPCRYHFLNAVKIKFILNYTNNTTYRFVVARLVDIQHRPKAVICRKMQPCPC